MGDASEVKGRYQDSAELPRRVVLASMAGVVSVMLLAALDGTIVGTAMPRVIADLHGFEHYALVTTVYMLAATVVVPIVGKLSDLDPDDVRLDPCQHHDRADGYAAWPVQASASSG